MLICRLLMYKLVEMWVRIFHQVVGCVEFEYLAVTQNDHPVRVEDGADAVSNSYNGALAEGASYSLLDKSISFLVDICCGFIDAQDL